MVTERWVRELVHTLPIAVVVSSQPIIFFHGHRMDSLMIRKRTVLASIKLVVIDTSGPWSLSDIA